MTSRDRISGRRYARVLLEMAVPQNLAERVKRELQSAATTYAAHSELTEVLRHPAIPAAQKKDLLSRIFLDSCPLVKRLLDLLVERRRSSLLPVIAEEYEALLNAQNGVVVAEAVSAVDLGEAERESLRRALSDVLGRTIELRTAIDPSVLGGVLVRAEGRVFDGTIRAQLGALRERLGGASHA